MRVCVCVCGFLFVCQICMCVPAGFEVWHRRRVSAVLPIQLQMPRGTPMHTPTHDTHRYTPCLCIVCTLFFCVCVCVCVCPPHTDAAAERRFGAAVANAITPRPSPPTHPTPHSIYRIDAATRQPPVSHSVIFAAPCAVCGGGTGANVYDGSDGWISSVSGAGRAVIPCGPACGWRHAYRCGVWCSVH